MKKQTMQLHHLAATPSVTQEEANKLSVFDYVDCVSKCESSKSTKLREEVDAPIADVTCNDEIWTGNEQLSERLAHTVITPVSLNQHDESNLFLSSLDTELVRLSSLSLRNEYTGPILHISNATTQDGRLLFLSGRLNGRASVPMLLDSGATHNFVACTFLLHKKLANGIQITG